MWEAKPEGFGHLLMGGAEGKKGRLLEVFGSQLVAGNRDRAIQDGQTRARKDSQTFPGQAISPAPIILIQIVSPS